MSLSLTRVMVFGTFDVLHKGHMHFFKQAKSLEKNIFLIVSVARDVNVNKIKKQKTFLSERERMNELKKIEIIDKVILGGITNYMAHIKKEQPDVIALGYDQVAYTQTLQKDLAEAGLKTEVVRLRPHRPHVYKSSLIKKKRGIL